MRYEQLQINRVNIGSNYFFAVRISLKPFYFSLMLFSCHDINLQCQTILD
jgi:hypothetical protein